MTEGWAKGKESDKIGDWLLWGELSGINHLHQEAFTVDQYSTSNEITRPNNFRMIDPGDFVWAGESYDHFILRRITSKNPKAYLLENLGSVMLEISWVALPFMSGTYTVVNQLESPGQICIDNRPSIHERWPRRRLPFRIICRCFLLNPKNLIRRRITRDNPLKRRPVYDCAIKWHSLLGRAKSFNA